MCWIKNVLPVEELLLLANVDILEELPQGEVEYVATRSAVVRLDKMESFALEAVVSLTAFVGLALTTGALIVGVISTSPDFDLLFNALLAILAPAVYFVTYSAFAFSGASHCTATVLQPGWYRLVRSGHTCSDKPAKTP